MRFAIRDALENTAKRTMIGNEIFGVSIGFASEVDQVQNQQISFPSIEFHGKEREADVTRCRDCPPLPPSPAGHGSQGVS